MNKLIVVNEGIEIVSLYSHYVPDLHEPMIINRGDYRVIKRTTLIDGKADKKLTIVIDVLEL